MSKRTTKSTNLCLTRMRYACAFFLELVDCTTRFAFLHLHPLFNLMVPLTSSSWTIPVQQFFYLKINKMMAINKFSCSWYKKWAVRPTFIFHVFVLVYKILRSSKLVGHLWRNQGLKLYSSYCHSLILPWNAYCFTQYHGLRGSLLS